MFKIMTIIRFGILEQGVMQEIIYPNFRKYFEPRQGTKKGV